MSLTRLQFPLKAAATLAFRPVILSVLSHRPEIPRLVRDLGRAVEGQRNASVRSQGVYRIRRKKAIPKKLGVKRTGDQYVIPGNIIFKQRGTLWHPGENTIMGRDHTIHSAIHGYVKYYRDPAKHPNRQYIGVTHEREESLPYPVHGVRRRKLDMITIPIRETPKPALINASGIPRRVVRTDEAVQGTGKDGKPLWGLPERQRTRVLNLQDNYSYTESNAAIGKLMPPVSFADWRSKFRVIQIRRHKAGEAASKTS